MSVPPRYLKSPALPHFTIYLGLHQALQRQNMLHASCVYSMLLLSHYQANVGSCLTQDYSYKPLNLTSDMMRALMLEHQVRPEFLDIASSFYLKVASVEEALCLPFQVFESPDYLG